ncbi:MAG: 30S ribosome-binding factor RbfA [Puniceicoccales bacterium]|jgi:ribosome-binding factor A|nr:30S ribosome-binding factor RbfA [Puniceicoccales bacterium]
MTQRTTRINQLLQREFSEVLHSRWRSEAVRITITGVDISPDLRQAIVFYSVIGDDTDKADARRLLKKVSKPLKAEVFKRVQIKYTPDLRFAYDDSSARGVNLISVLDEVAEEDKERDSRYPKKS